MRALLAERVTAGYSRVPIIRDVSVSVDPGQVAAIVGPNGAGKSTFAKSITGVVKKQEGRVLVGDTDISGLPAHLVVREGLAYVPQNHNVFASLSVIENLEMGAFTRTQGVRQRVAEVLEIFPDLKVAARKRAGALSGGQQNMLAMARALMLDPRVIVLDEPTAGLSPAYTDVVWAQVARIAATGTGVLVVEQNVDRALANAAYVYVLVAGVNHVEGPAAEVAALDLAGIFLGRDEQPDRAGASAVGADVRVDN